MEAEFGADPDGNYGLIAAALLTLARNCAKQRHDLIRLTMAKKRRLVTLDEILRHSPREVSRSAVRTAYPKWRKQQGMPLRCDMQDCIFHEQALLWRGQKLPLILDHENGNKLDNRPQNLRYLCPNCDSQLETRGGANRGRVVDNGEGFYTLWSRRHSRHELYLLPEAAQLRITGHAPTISIGLASPKAEYRAGPAGST